jgi:hypothetical protein
MVIYGVHIRFWPTLLYVLIRVDQAHLQVKQVALDVFMSCGELLGIMC